MSVRVVYLEIIHTDRAMLPLAQNLLVSRRTHDVRDESLVLIQYLSEY